MKKKRSFFIFLLINKFFSKKKDKFLFFAYHCDEFGIVDRSSAINIGLQILLIIVFRVLLSEFFSIKSNPMTPPQLNRQFQIDCVYQRSDQSGKIFSAGINIINTLSLQFTSYHFVNFILVDFYAQIQHDKSELFL